MLAIGEAGLDKICNVDFSLQLKYFEKQIQISEQFKKPLIIHCVKAFNEIIQLKKLFKPRQSWIIHGFNKNEETAQQLMKNDIKLSFGADLLKSKKLQTLLKGNDFKNIFLETDDRDVSIEKIYIFAAGLKECSLEEFKQQIYGNFKTIFGDIF